MQKKLKNYTHKKLIRLAVPIASSGLLNKIASMIAVLFLAQLGNHELAASALSFGTFITVLTVCITSLYSVSILCSHAKGEANEDKVSQIVKNGFCMALLLGLPFSFVLWHAGSVLAWCRQDPALIKLTIPYFHLISLALLPTMFNMVLIQFYLGIAKPKIAFVKTVLSLPFLIFLSYAFILGKFGFPQLELAGIAAAILIIQTLSCILMFVYMYFDSSVAKYSFFSKQAFFDYGLCKQLLKIGLPIGLQVGGELAAMTAVTYLLGHFGVDALAAGQIVSQYGVLVVMITIGLSQALSVLTSEACGKKAFALIEKYKQSSFKLASYLFVFIVILFVFFGKVLMMPYIDIDDPSNARIVHLATIFFYISGVTLYIDAIRNMLSASLRGLHKSIFPMVIGVLTLWGISLPVCYLLAFTFSGGPIALRFGFMSGFVIAVFILNRYLKKMDFQISRSRRLCFPAQQKHKPSLFS